MSHRHWFLLCSGSGLHCCEEAFLVVVEELQVLHHYSWGWVCWLVGWWVAAEMGRYVEFRHGQQACILTDLVREILI